VYVGIPCLSFEKCFDFAITRSEAGNGSPSLDSERFEERFEEQLQKSPSVRAQSPIKIEDLNIVVRMIESEVSIQGLNKKPE